MKLHRKHTGLPLHCTTHIAQYAPSRCKWRILQPPYPCIHVGADLRVCPFAVMFALVQRCLPCNETLCMSLRMGVAGNAPTAVAVIANRANTQVCPYIVWRFRHWGAGAIVGATFTVALVRLPRWWVLRLLHLLYSCVLP
jgi:hypothetical protein